MKQNISFIQGILLIVSTITPTVILSVPNTIALFSKQDAWISILISMIVGMAFAWLIGAICKQNTDLPFLDWLESRLGLISRIIVGILLTAYYLVTLSFIMREFVNFMLANVLNATPAYALLMVTGGVIVYAVSQGVIVIARVNLIVVLVTFLIFLVVTPFLVKHIDYHLLLPLADNPVLRIVQGSLAPIGWFSEVAVLLLMLPYLNNPSQASRIALWGVAACGSLLLLTVVITLAIYGPNFTAKLSYPTFSLIGIIDISKFLERIDILIISLWICSMYVKMSVFLFCTFHCFVHTFRIQLKMPILLAIGLFSVVASYFYWPKSTDMDYFQAYTLIPLLLAFNVLLPLLIWLCTSLMANKTVKGSS